MGNVTSKTEESGSDPKRNTYLAGVTMQVCVPGTRQKYHSLRHKKKLDGYDDFNTYVVIGSLRATKNFGRLDIQRHVMILEASRVVSRLSHNNKEYDSSINPLRTVSTQILQTCIVTNLTTTVRQNLNILRT